VVTGKAVGGNCQTEHRNCLGGYSHFDSLMSLDFVAPIGVVVIIDLTEMQLIGAVSASICEMYHCLAAVLISLTCHVHSSSHTHLTTKSVLVMMFSVENPSSIPAFSCVTQTYTSSNVSIKV
jgi:hypothetical protein